MQDDDSDRTPTTPTTKPQSKTDIINAHHKLALNSQRAVAAASSPKQRTWTCEPLAPQHFSGMEHILSDAFWEREGTARVLGARYAENLAYYKQYVPWVATQNLSIAAVSKRTYPPQVIGGFTAHDITVAEPEFDEEPESAARWDPIEYLVDYAIESYRKYITAEPYAVPWSHGTHVFLDMLAVDEHWTGRGVGHDLVREILQHAKDRGYKYAMSVATHVASQVIFARAGFITFDKVEFKTWEYKGEKPFMDVQEPTHALFVFKPLDDLPPSPQKTKVTSEGAS